MNTRMLIGVLALAGCGAGVWVWMDRGATPEPVPTPLPSALASAPEPAVPVALTALPASQPAVKAASAASVARAAMVQPPLISRVQSALATQDGKAAMALMLELDVCRTVDQIADKAYKLAAEAAASSASDPTRDKTFRAVQRHQVQCQAMAGQLPTLQAQLLSLASRQQVRGAAVRLVNLGGKDTAATLAELRPQILRDAMQGDLGSVVRVFNPEVVSNQVDMHVLARGIGLAAADEDPSKKSLLWMLGQSAEYFRSNAKTAFSAEEEAEIARRAEVLRDAINADARLTRQRLTQLLGE